jgi:hypothetical protein
MESEPERSLDMKKTMTVLGVMICVTLLAGPALADNCGSVTKASTEGATCSRSAEVQASYEGTTCSKSAAKVAYAKALEETGCEKTAKDAYNNTLAERAYSKSYAETSCSRTAEKAAYEAVYASSSCQKTSQSAATHAVAKASYDATYAKTGCAKTSQAAYDEVTKTAGASCATAAKADCDKGIAKSTSEVVAEADVKTASNEQGSSR